MILKAENKSCKTASQPGLKMEPNAVEPRSSSRAARESKGKEMPKWEGVFKGSKDGAGQRHVSHPEPKDEEILVMGRR